MKREDPTTNSTIGDDHEGDGSMADKKKRPSIVINGNGQHVFGNVVGGDLVVTSGDDDGKAAVTGSAADKKDRKDKE